MEQSFFYANYTNSHKLISPCPSLSAKAWLAVRLGYSFVGVFNRWLDKVFVRVLCKWNDAWKALKATAK